MKNRFYATDQGYNHGGHLLGEVSASYAQLVALLGKPNSDGDDYKVTTEWIVKDSQTGQFFTLYAWKATRKYDDKSAPTVAKFRKLPSYDWHIGGTADPSAFKAWILYMIERSPDNPEVLRNAIADHTMTGFMQGQLQVCDVIRRKLAAYQTEHAKAMLELRATEYATDIATIAARASRQLAVIQALETILAEVGADE